MAERPDPPATDQGLVVALEANYCRVVLDTPRPQAPSVELLCTRRTRLGHAGRRVCVGDRVRVEAIDWNEQRAAVAAVAPRRNLLPRPAVANVDRVVVVASLREPRLDPLQLTRFLISAETAAGEVALVFTKTDLASPGLLRRSCEAAAAWGYRVTPVSVTRGEGLGALADLLRRPGISVLCGPSGVGKSSLLNALVPALALRVGAVSGRLRRGRHTTRHVELFPLAAAALVADTPGFNRPSLPGSGEELAAAFPEVRDRLAGGGCHFRDCRHLQDPGCRVGTDWDRWPLYRRCREELEREAAAGLNLPGRAG